MQRNTELKPLEGCEHEFWHLKANEIPIYANRFGVIVGGKTLGYHNPWQMLLGLLRWVICLRPDGVMIFREEISVIRDKKTGVERYCSLDATRGYIRYDFPNLREIIRISGCVIESIL